MTTPRSNGRTTPRKPKVDFDLDKLDDEGRFAEVPPFTFRHKGKEFSLGSPDDVDFFDVVEFGSSPAGQAMLVCKLLGDQLDEFRAAGPIPARKINALMDRYQEHYGALNQGEAGALSAS